MEWNKFRLFKKEPNKKTEQQVRYKGEQANALLKSSSYTECMQGLEDKIWADFFRTEANDPEAREVLYRHIQALRYIDSQLKETAEAGKASATLEKMNNAR